MEVNYCLHTNCYATRAAKPRGGGQAMRDKGFLEFKRGFLVMSVYCAEDYFKVKAVFDSQGEACVYAERLKKMAPSVIYVVVECQYV